MDLGLDGAINGFQKKIGTYDKANWEITVEKQEVHQVLNETLSVAKLPTDLLDIDLIRGSTFTKAKPGYHWTQVTRSGIFKVLFFPGYHRWWRQQIPLPVWLFFLLLYFLQLLSLVIYIGNQPHEDLTNVSWPEAFVPLVAMVLLGEMYIHVVSTNFTKPIVHKIKKNKKRASDTGSCRKSRRKNRTDKNADSIIRNLLSESNTLHDHQVDDSREASREASVERVLKVGEVAIIDQIDNADKKIDIRKDNMKSSNSMKKRLLKQTVSSSSENEVKAYETTTMENGEGIDENNQKRKVCINHSSASVEETSTEETDSDSSTSSISDHDITNDTETAKLLFPNSEGVMDVTPSNMLCQIRNGNDLITVSIWDGKSFKKAKLTFFEIGIAVVNKVETRKDTSSDYINFAVLSSLIIGLLPLLFRIYQSHVVDNERTILEAANTLSSQLQSKAGICKIYHEIFGKTWQSQVVIIIAMVSRITLSFSMFFLLCVAEGAYKARYLYAKFFAALTSTRKSRRNGLPHFRLHKVKNIKAWLSLRSFLKKRGPQRSVDTIVSIAFIFGVLMLVITCVQFLAINGKDDKDHFLTYFFSWEVSAWSLVVGVFLVRFIALGSDINRKYRNTSILLTEQINLYLQMEKNPSKKDELLIANNVLKLASKLLKDLEGPFKVSGFIMNPLLSNIVRVVVLSLFSGVMSDILGFRLRLWKIKA